MKIEKITPEVTYNLVLTQAEVDIITSVLGSNCTSIGYKLFSALEEAGGNPEAYRVYYDGEEISYELEKA
jgi:hypothetical protein